MKLNKIVVSLAVLALATVSLWAATPVKEDSFAIVLPDGFQQFAKQTQNGAKVTTYVSKNEKGEIVIVSHALMAPTEDLDAYLAKEKNSLVKSLKATLESEQAIEIDGQKGISFNYAIQGARPMFGRTDMVVANPRLYQVIYLTAEQASVGGANVVEMFSSFDLNEEAIAAAMPESEASNETVSSDQ